MMDLAMNFDTDECLVTAMFDKGNRNDTMEEEHIRYYHAQMKKQKFSNKTLLKIKTCALRD